MHWKKINNNGKSFVEASKSLMYIELKKRGFNDFTLIKNWQHILSECKICSEKDLNLLRIKGGTLYLSTDKLNIYSEFTFFKNTLKTAVCRAIPSLNINEIKIEFIN